MKILVTGSSGLIGSEVCTYFGSCGHSLYGIDNNQRAKFFGPNGDTSWRLRELRNALPSFNHIELDIRERNKIIELLKELKPDAIVHTAAQPSHDWAYNNPLLDFRINSVGTLNLLELFRKFTPNSKFIFTSTNKVYGDNPNKLAFVEKKKRLKLKKSKKYFRGICE